MQRLSRIANLAPPNRFAEAKFDAVINATDLIFGAKFIRRIDADFAKFFTADAGKRIVVKIWIYLADGGADENVFIKRFVIPPARWSLGPC